MGEATQKVAALESRSNSQNLYATASPVRKFPCSSLENGMSVPKKAGDCSSDRRCSFTRKDTRGCPPRWDASGDELVRRAHYV